jgi:uncharacterized protein (DUF302 family)
LHWKTSSFIFGDNGSGEIMSEQGLVSLPSRYAARETTERLLAALAKRNMTVFARVDHAAGAAAAGLSLRPTEVVLFGNPKGGTALMEDQQSAGIDLPLKALVWEGADQKVWLSYNDPKWIALRHGLGTKSAAAVEAMAAALGAMAAEVTR